ncbi:uncharacterized protein BYT42DRAFT_165231 [Radiomyces spectabilis]|uniref:uncharacterized protein n=1 Tax=Radiomyces spectabilis TaxID=64574 RepID=UPI0022208B09|nr:uncharacterized protein BYT42DRAFT_165231 [Radiomyces spectabilis]KAI8364674.1 hypothetical protein BYT42DRAFT_165231 [Radiomyces spectabilis]
MSYWYSTDGMDKRRLSTRHLPALDQAFERRTRVEIYDDEAFGNHVAIANPYQGTMTAGDIHYGLYRHPTLWRISDASLDTSMLIDSSTAIMSADTHPSDSSPRSRFTAIETPSTASSSLTAADKTMRKSSIQDTREALYRQRRRASVAPNDDHCNCCIIS